ncbi:MAG TPA: orotidine-5'-phosphate decarboxylase [Candidatus Paceibacterota bacterium]|nr:orotidine-5'-phosphate decarboxylase [Candidatus Paceibacterota bacterium]
MIRKSFRELVEARWSEQKFMCVGLDPDIARIPEHVRAGKNAVDSIIAFNRTIIEATHDLVCAYKPNSAFYEALGSEGIAALKTTLDDIHTIAPDVPVILDAKRADIGSTNEGYAMFAFEYLEADALTVHPYLGHEALRPFLQRSEKGIIVLCRTSNAGAGEFQDLQMGEEPLYMHIARAVVSKWNTNGNCALVVGATYPEELKAVRSIAPDMPILIPGIGAQGGDLEATVRAGKDKRGAGMMINSSRGIIYASVENDFADAARHATMKMNEDILRYRKSL